MNAIPESDCLCGHTSLYHRGPQPIVPSAHGSTCVQCRCPAFMPAPPPPRSWAEWTWSEWWELEQAHLRAAGRGSWEVLQLIGQLVLALLVAAGTGVLVLISVTVPVVGYIVTLIFAIWLVGRLLEYLDCGPRYRY
jgi:hypothetical protein